MQKKTFANLSALILLLSFLFPSNQTFAQASYDQVNNPRQYYYNNFTGATLATPSTYFPGGGSTRSANATIGMVSSGGITGNTLSSLALNQVGYLQWSFMSNTGAGNVGLGSAVWEWEFDYKNVDGTVAPGNATNNITASTSAATDSWRYWLISSSYVATNSTLGLFVTVSGTNLKILTRYNAANAPVENVSIPLPLNNNVYQIRIIKNATGAYFIHILNRTTNTTTSYTNGGGGYNIGNSNTVDLNTYNYSFLECSTTTANRFQWDNFNFYQQKLEYIPIIGTEKGITPSVYPGIVDAIVYGVNVNIRGDIPINRFVCKATANSQALFESGALWKTTSSVLSTSSPASKVSDLNVYSDGTSQFTLPSSEKYYSGGNIDGTTVNVTNYFLVLKGRNPFYGGYPNSLSWSVSSTADDNYSPAYTNGVTPISPTTSGTTAAGSPAGNLYDWTGASTSWNASGAWKKNTSASTENPSASTDIVRIGVVNYTGGANQPQMTGNISVASVQVGKLGSASTTTASTVTLDMKGNTLTASRGLTVDAGANLTLANTNTLAASTLNVAGTSTMASTASINFSASVLGITLANTGTFTLASDANGSAAIGTLNTNNSITGQYKVQRYVTGGTIAYRGYRLFSSPVYEATMGTGINAYNIYGVAYTKSTAYITGTSGTTGGFDATAATPTIYLYREDKTASNTATGGNFRGVNKINNSPAYNLNIDNETGNFNIPVGNGFMFFFRGSRATNPSTITTVVPDAATFTQTGSLNQGDVQVKLWYTPTSTTLGKANTRFNLVGNPYASTIDWDNFSSNNPSASIYGPNVSNTIYVYNSAAKTYATYDKTSGTNNGSRYIPSGQGFYVLANNTGTASLKFTEAGKASSQQVSGSNLLMSNGTIAEQAAPQYFKLQLVKDDINKEDVVVRFNKNASTNYVFNEDSPYFQGSSAINLYTVTADNTNLAINELPFSEKTQVIPVCANVTSSGLYQLKLSELKNMPNMFDIWLKDAYMKDSLDLKNNTTYNFNADITDSKTFGSNRFSLVIRPNAAYSYRLLDFTAKQQTKTVQLNWKAENEANYTYFTVERSINGGKTFDIIGSASGKSLSTYSLVDNAPATGENQYRLKQEDFFGKVTYSKIVPVMYAPIKTSIANKIISVYPNPVNKNVTIAINSNTNNTAAYNISITNTTGRTVKTYTSAGLEWQGDFSDLLPGTYFIQVVNNKDKSVVGNNTFIKL